MRRSRLRRRGRVGRNVRIAPGAIVEAEKVDIGDDVEIGPGAIIRAKELAIGSGTSIGALCYLDCPVILIGRNTRIREQVYIGGLTTPRSRIEIGDQVTVYQFTVMNPAEPIRIGDRVGIGGKCCLFTHGSWQSMFKGYPAGFGPITIGADAWLPWEVFVMPGVTIGEGATIGARSLVKDSVPARSLAVGSPARVIHGPPEYPPIPTPEGLESLLRGCVDDFVASATGDPWRSERDPKPGGELVKLWKGSQGPLRILVCYRSSSNHHMPEMASLSENDAIIAIEALTPGITDALRTVRSSWMVLDADRAVIKNQLGEELELFLERYGVRFPLQAPPSSS